MIDIHKETLVSLSELSHRLPGRPNLSTLHRWRQRGIHGVTLETILIGGKRFCSLEAAQRFVDATTAVADGNDMSALSICESTTADHRALVEDGILV
jgi:hypothetical protein